MLIVELAVAVVVVGVVLFLVEVNPYLISTKPSSSISVYSQKEFGNATITLSPGQSATARFNYSTYDPAILVIDLTFQNWRAPGDLSIYINGSPISTIYAPPGKPQTRLSIVSFSGQDWVKAPGPDSFTYGNEITFVSEPVDGYDGTITYQISIRGSR
jgi:hypothetical protein